MRQYLSPYEGAFQPEDVHVLIAAFDAAWESALAAGAIFEPNEETESARQILAQNIINAAMQGEHDRKRLRQGALVALANANLRSTPCRRLASEAK
jgi:hypothetical protein